MRVPGFVWVGPVDEMAAFGFQQARAVQLTVVMVGPERTQVSDNAPGVSRTTAKRATLAGVVTRNGSGVRVSG